MKGNVVGKERIEIPEGCFEGNCRDCRYANRNDTKPDGRVYCDGPYGGYNYPENRNGCIHYKRV